MLRVAWDACLIQYTAGILDVAGLGVVPVLLRGPMVKPQQSMLVPSLSEITRLLQSCLHARITSTAALQID